LIIYSDYQTLFNKLTNPNKLIINESQERN